MDKEQLRDTVKAIIDGIFSEKEEEARQRMTEDAITKSTTTINELTQALAEQKDSHSALEVKYNEAAETVTEQAAKLSAMESDKQKVDEELAAVKADLEKTKADFDALTASTEDSLKELSELKAVIAEAESVKVAEARYLMLDEAGIGYKDKEKQIEKIKPMTEEAFESYKEELLAIKEALTVATTLTDEEVAAAAAAAAASEPEGKDKVALANVDKKLTFTTAFNAELKAKDDLMVKYQKLGEALAAKVKKDKD